MSGSLIIPFPVTIQPIKLNTLKIIKNWLGKTKTCGYIHTHIYIHENIIKGHEHKNNSSASFQKLQVMEKKKLHRLNSTKFNISHKLNLTPNILKTPTLINQPQRQHQKLKNHKKIWNNSIIYHIPYQGLNAPQK